VKTLRLKEEGFGNAYCKPIEEATTMTIMPKVSNNAFTQMLSKFKYQPGQPSKEHANYLP